MITNHTVPLLFRLEDTDFQKQTFWFCLTTEQFSTSQSSLNELWPREDGSVTGWGSDMAFFFAVFTDSDFWKCSWAHAVISLTESSLFLMQCRPRAWRSLASSIDLQPCPLHSEMSPDSLNLLMILCTVDDGIFNTLTIFHLETQLWNLFSLLLQFSFRLLNLCTFTSRRLFLLFYLIILLLVGNYITLLQHVPLAVSFFLPFLIIFFFYVHFAQCPNSFGIGIVSKDCKTSKRFIITDYYYLTISTLNTDYPKKKWKNVLVSLTKSQIWG